MATAFVNWYIFDLTKCKRRAIKKRTFFDNYVILLTKKLKLMKKLLIFVALIAMCILATVSCSEKSKKTASPLGNGMIMLVDYHDGFYGLETPEGVPLVNSEVFDSIGWNEDLELVEAWKRENRETTLITPEGVKILTDNVTSITPVGEGFCKVLTADEKAYMLAGPLAQQNLTVAASSVWGKFSDIEVAEKYMFFKSSDNLWGATMISPNQGLAPRNYSNVYIIKNDKKAAVLVKNSKGWQMFDSRGVSEGSPYPLSSKQIEQQLKTVKLPDAPVGVVSVKWKL